MRVELLTGALDHLTRTTETPDPNTPRYINPIITELRRIIWTEKPPNISRPLKSLRMIATDQPWCYNCISYTLTAYETSPPLLPTNTTKASTLDWNNYTIEEMPFELRSEVLSESCEGVQLDPCCIVLQRRGDQTSP
jgi:hypothetical protein